MAKDSAGLFPVPKRYSNKVIPGSTRSISCPDCSDCVDIHKLKSGDVLLVNTSGSIKITAADFTALKNLPTD